MRLALLCLLSLCVASTAQAKSKVIEVRHVASSPQGMVKQLAAEKPGPFRDKVMDALLTRMLTRAPPLDEPDAVDAMTRQMFDHIFADMAAANDVWVWEANASPRGDVLIRETVTLQPGRTSSGFTHAVTVSPAGKRIDRGYLNTPCTVRVSVAKSERDWHVEAETNGRWVAAVHPVLASEGVALVAVSLLSPTKGEPPAPRHERPVWVAFFEQGADGQWQPAWFDPATATEQRLQESNLFPAGAKKLSEGQRRLALALRMEDVRLINPARAALSKDELKWVTLEGLGGPVVDAKSRAWLLPWLESDSPLVRAVAAVRLARLGEAVKPMLLVSALREVRALPVQVEARAALVDLVRAGTKADDEILRVGLAKAPGDEVYVLGDVAMVRSGAGDSFFAREGGAWKAVEVAR